MDVDSEIYEPYDHHQREKSTGSGLVLAVPAMVLETMVLDTKDEQEKEKMVNGGAEYENLVTDNQYYEQVEFGNHVRPVIKQKICDFDDSLYSIPQVMSSTNSTKGLTTNVIKKGLSFQALGQRLSSVRKSLSRNNDKKKPSQKQISVSKSVEDMYSKPNKFSLPVVPDNNPSLVIVTKKTHSITRKQIEDDSKSYMSVHFQGKKPKNKESSSPSCLTCDRVKLKKYFVMTLLVSCLVSLLTVGLYFMSDNVVTVSPETMVGVNKIKRRSYIYESFDKHINGNMLHNVDKQLDRSSAWRDYSKINWGSVPSSSRSFVPTTSRTSFPSSSSASWSSWSSWSICTRNPCIKGETIARSRRCLQNGTNDDADMKECIKQGGTNVEMEPCFCF